MSLDELFEDTETYNQPFNKLNDRAKKYNLYFDICFSTIGDIFALCNQNNQAVASSKTLSGLHDYLDFWETGKELNEKKDNYNVYFYPIVQNELEPFVF